MKTNVPVRGIMFIVCTCMLLFASNVYSLDNTTLPSTPTNLDYDLLDLKEPTFKRVVIGDSMDEYSCETESIKVIFRKDRIEFIDKSTKESEYFFLIFEDVDKMNHTGNDLLDHHQANIEGTAIARVLKSNIKEVYQYENLSSIIDDRYELNFHIKDGHLEISIPAGLDLEMHLFNTLSPDQRSAKSTSIPVGKNNLEFISNDFSFDSSTKKWKKVNNVNNDSLIKISL